MKDAVFYVPRAIGLGGQLLPLNPPAIMGILNVTPDSFYDGGKHVALHQVLRQAGQMLAEGAHIIDVGGYSTRPGAAEVSEEEEIGRTVPVVKALAKAFPQAHISIDTFRAEVARQAVGEGACLINDVSGGSLDAQMLPTAAALQVPYVLTHIRGTPQTMQEHTHYQDILLDMLQYFRERLLRFYELGGKEAIVDIGFGFAKTLEQNYFLLDHLAYFRALHCPLLVGLSRKSMIYRKLGLTPADALNGTTALHALAVRNGASMLRVHDVKEAREVISLLS